MASSSSSASSVPVNPNTGLPTNAPHNAIQRLLTAFQTERSDRKANSGRSSAKKEDKERVLQYMRESQQDVLPINTDAGVLYLVRKVKGKDAKIDAEVVGFVMSEFLRRNLNQGSHEQQHANFMNLLGRTLSRLQETSESLTLTRTKPRKAMMRTLLQTMSGQI